MGTHPIFESDFDCLTEWVGPDQDRDRKRRRDRSRDRSRERRTRSRSREPKERSDAILIRSRSNTPDVKIEVESTNQQSKKFESVNKIEEPEKDVVLVDEIASSAYAKTFYKSKELEKERLRLKDERERLEKERAEREKLLQPNEPDENESMMAMMGFSNFDTTQNKKVDGNNIVGVSRTHKQRKYRQYMNRKGGFNRPLDQM